MSRPPNSEAGSASLLFVRIWLDREFGGLHAAVRELLAKAAD